MVNIRIREYICFRSLMISQYPYTIYRSLIPPALAPAEKVKVECEALKHNGEECTGFRPTCSIKKLEDHLKTRKHKQLTREERKGFIADALKVLGPSYRQAPDGPSQPKKRKTHPGEDSESESL